MSTEITWIFIGIVGVLFLILIFFKLNFIEKMFLAIIKKLYPPE